MKEHDEQHSLMALGREVRVVAHELNNPIVGISMASQMIGLSLSRLKDLLTAQTEDSHAALEIVALMETELVQMAHSITLASTLKESLLAFGQPFDLVPCEIQPLLKTILAHLQDHPNLKGLTLRASFQPEPSPMMACNALKLEQVMYNLLNNAARATEGHGEVWIRQDMTGDTIVIEVEDNGPGLSHAVLAKFAQEADVIPEAQGHGLGLAICREIVAQHGGLFSVYNKPSSGACFRLAFPVVVERPGHHVV